MYVRREDHRETPEVHVAGLVVDGDRVLLHRRAPHRMLYPGMWEGCGGQLRAGEGFADGVRRHFLEELGVAVRVLLDRHALYEIAHEGQVIPGVRFLCEIPGEAPLRVNLQWFTAVQLPTDLVPGLREVALDALGAADD